MIVTVTAKIVLLLMCVGEPETRDRFCEVKKKKKNPQQIITGGGHYFAAGQERVGGV